MGGGEVSNERGRQKVRGPHWARVTCDAGLTYTSAPLPPPLAPSSL